MHHPDPVEDKREAAEEPQRKRARAEQHDAAPAPAPVPDPALDPAHAFPLGVDIDAGIENHDEKKDEVHDIMWELRQWFSEDAP